MKNFFRYKLKKNAKGSTLIELLIAVVIFSVVMTAVIVILISAVKANKQIIAKQENIDNARYSMDFMIKELRMAKENLIDSTLTFNNGNTSNPAQIKNTVVDKFSFYIVNPSNPSSFVSVTYSLGAVSGRGEIRRQIGTGSATAISAENINVTGLKFFVNDWDLNKGSGTAPLITVFMEMRGTVGAAVNEIVNLQSAVAPRVY